MTTKDKTGDQLMASIRKAKTEGATPASGTADTPPAAPATPKPAAAGAATKRPPTTRKKAAAKPRTAKTTTAAKASAYQSSGRVWPD